MPNDKEQKNEAGGSADRSAYFEHLFQSVPAGVVLLDREDRIIDCNTWFTDLFHYAIEEARGRKINDLIVPEHLQNEGEETTQQVAAGQSVFFETVRKKKDGELLYVSVSGQPISINEGDISVIGVYQDITDRRRAEEELIEREENLRELNSTKDTFISVLSHDLRSPFTSILGFSDILLENIEHADRQKIHKQVEIIRDQASTTLRLLDDVLSWAKVQSGKMLYNPIPIAFPVVCSAVLDNLRAYAEEKNICVDCSEMSDIELFADENMLQVVLRNLISNAIKFTPYGGRVQIAASKEQGFAKITVSDSGIGIDSSNIPKLWDLTRHHSTEGTAGERGTGYGLVLCKELVEKLGGNIWAESAPGRGSDFIFTLPLS